MIVLLLKHGLNPFVTSCIVSIMTKAVWTAGYINLPIGFIMARFVIRNGPAWVCTKVPSFKSELRTIHEWKSEQWLIHCNLQCVGEAHTWMSSCQIRQQS
jgi:hypothetical protein